MEIVLERALLWIVLLPLLGAAINGILGRHSSRAAVHMVAVGTVAGAFALALAGFGYLMMMRWGGEEEVKLTFTAYHWFSLTVKGAEAPIYVRFVMDSLSGVMALVVTGVGLLIHIYACGYMAEDPSYARFFSYMNLFTASMLVLVLGSNLPVMFVGWEGVGLCSYLLIGFWYENRAFAAAGRKAFVTNRIGDFGALIGMFLLVQAVGSFEFEAINKSVDVLTGRLAFSAGNYGMTVATAATLFLFLGCTGKSAQIPLFVWLPDAMAGPTPVSALIHAATMVTSGVYLICRLSPVFAAAPHSMAVVAVVGTLTALLAASIALVQVDIKRVLAYSTVSQLGFMFAAVGCGAFAAGFFHLYTHAFFKACLFLGAGSVMHAVGAHGDADIRTLGGLRRYQPRTHWTFLVSCLAISGVPLFSGFFSKDEILVGALSVGPYFFFAPWLGNALFALLVAAATMTAFYMFRLYFMTFSGAYRGGPAHEHGAGGHGHADEHGRGEPHESPGSMTWPLVFLGIGAILAGYWWVGIARLEPWVKWLEPALGRIGAEESHGLAYVAAGFGVLAAFAGIGLAWAWYGRPAIETPRLLAERMPGAYRLLRDKWRVDELYEATVLGGSRGLAMASANVDKSAVDGLLTDVTSYVVQGLSYVFTRVQNGAVHAYGAVMAAGMVLVAWWFLTPHPQVSAKAPEGRTGANLVNLAAGAGLGYRYRWDFDSDGRFDTGWRSEPAASHEYKSGEFQPGPVVILQGVGYGAKGEQIKLNPGQELRPEAEQLGRWRREDSKLGIQHPELAGVLPHITATTDGIVVRPNGALVRHQGRIAEPTEQVSVGPGDKVGIGEVELTVAGAVRATVAVKNVLDVGAKDSVMVTLARAPGRARLEVEPGGVR